MGRQALDSEGPLGSLKVRSLSFSLLSQCFLFHPLFVVVFSGITTKVLKSQILCIKLGNVKHEKQMLQLTLKFSPSQLEMNLAELHFDILRYHCLLTSRHTC